LECLKHYEGSTISLHGCGASGAYAAGPDEKKNRTEEEGFNTLRKGLLNCLNARSGGLNFRHRASCI